MKKDVVIMGSRAKTSMEMIEDDFPKGAFEGGMSNEVIPFPPDEEDKSIVTVEPKRDKREKSLDNDDYVSPVEFNPDNPADVKREWAEKQPDGVIAKIVGDNLDFISNERFKEIAESIVVNFEKYGIFTKKQRGMIVNCFCYNKDFDIPEDEE